VDCRPEKGGHRASEPVGDELAVEDGAGVEDRELPTEPAEGVLKRLPAQPLSDLAPSVSRLYPSVRGEDDEAADASTFGSIAHRLGSAIAARSGRSPALPDELGENLDRHRVVPSR
jgi:hypothetical protein